MKMSRKWKQSGGRPSSIEPYSPRRLRQQIAYQPFISSSPVPLAKQACTHPPESPMLSAALAPVEVANSAA
jgi:hypothetical protein